MSPGTSTVRVAIVQEPPAILDLAEGVRRASKHIESAAAEGARLVAFPETWLTGYPAWVFGLAGWDNAEARHWYAALVQQSPSSDASELDPVRGRALRATRHLHPHRRPSPPGYGPVDRRRRLHGLVSRIRFLQFSFGD